MSTKSEVASMCDEALRRIDEAILRHESGRDADLTPALLKIIRPEVEQMRSVLDPSVSAPSYPRAMIDSWMGYDRFGLIDFLMELGHQYGLLRESKGEV